ncbi:FecR domain-containing protein [Pelomonas sp. SE-A7]|uniref:FecR family protein n=1 Tax=Pelomonas sp. SE-A7 TaxID=3054953 RepID=UPI00259CAEB4|nr:FecR domain-containing protein [Pelomonas sp. SE-A7]MDM4766647.1 FecR domain-containing protein [Pelomonas sp. SE-A7]
MLTSSQIIEERAADWIAARDRALSAGEWTPARQAELDGWIAESTAHRVAWLRLDAAWRQADRLVALKDRQAGAAAERNEPTRPRRWLPSPGRARWAIAVPGVFALALLLVLGLPRMPEAQKYQTEVGAREVVALKDGSRMTLNTATRVRAEIASESREVWLEGGEAYFEVAHDPAHPFIVHAGKHKITVLGTKFTVRRQGDDVRVQVSEGRVQVAAGTAPPTVLARNDTAIAEPESVLVAHKTPHQIQADLNWLQGKLVFDQLSLADAAREFNRYNRKQLVIDDAEVARIEIGGVFDANNVDAFARLLRVGFQLEVQVRGDEIHIGRPKS